MDGMDVQALCSWIQAGVDINSADYDRRTALHVACAVGDVDAVATLLQCPAINRKARVPRVALPATFVSDIIPVIVHGV